MIGYSLYRERRTSNHGSLNHGLTTDQKKIYQVSRIDKTNLALYDIVVHSKLYFLDKYWRAIIFPSGMLNTYVY